MTDPTAGDPTTGEEATASRAGMPRWVKVSLIVVGLLIATFVVLQLAGVGGEHGPSRHMGPSGQGPSSSEHRPPAGVDHGR